MSEATDEKRMKLRYPGVCRVCGADLEARAEAIYERATKTVRCLTCPAAVPAVDRVAERGTSEPHRDDDSLDSGVPGASARREFERRQTNRRARIREKHPMLGDLILAVKDDPQSTTAWHAGALGEERLGQRLNELSSPTMRALHDRRIPGSRANIDHIAVTATGIYVIDAKRYKDKRPSLKVERGLFRPRVEKLLVGSRDQTKLVDGVLKQVEVVRSIVGDDVPITGVLCFIEADWPLIGGAFATRGVKVLWPKKLYSRLLAAGSIDAQRISSLSRLIAESMRSA